MRLFVSQLADRSPMCSKTAVVPMRYDVLKTQLAIVHHSKGRIMGIFGSREEKLENKAQQYRSDGMFQYAETVRASLAPKDGKVHVVMLNSFSKFLNQTFECENKYTGQIDAIISAMQDDGYEILDVKFNSIQGQGLTGSMEGFHTLVMYR